MSPFGVTRVTFAVTPSAPSTRSMRSVEMSFVLRLMLAVTRVREVCASAEGGGRSSCAIGLDA